MPTKLMYGKSKLLDFHVDAVKTLQNVWFSPCLQLTFFLLCHVSPIKTIIYTSTLGIQPLTSTLSAQNGKKSRFSM